MESQNERKLLIYFVIPWNEQCQKYHRLEDVLLYFNYNWLIVDCKTVSFFLSFFCCSGLEISMRDAGMCDARIKGSHTSVSRQSHS